MTRILPAFLFAASCAHRVGPGSTVVIQAIPDAEGTRIGIEVDGRPALSARLLVPPEHCEVVDGPTWAEVQCTVMQVAAVSPRRGTQTLFPSTYTLGIEALEEGVAAYRRYVDRHMLDVDERMALYRGASDHVQLSARIEGVTPSQR